LPGAAPYMGAAYGSGVYAFVGSERIIIRNGQQGDPLLPITASRVISCFIRSHLPEVWARLDYRAGYIDDWAVMGPEEDVALVIRTFLEKGPDYGLHLNLGKCQAILSDASAGQTFYDLGVPISLAAEGFELLGAPIGDTDFIQSFLRDALGVARNRLCALHSLSEHPHKAFALQKFSLGQSLIGHLLRTCGPSEHWGGWDDAVIEAFESYSGVTIGAANRDRACAPIKDGGLGFRPTTRLAPLCALASTLEASSNLNWFFPRGIPSDAQDPLLRMVERDLGPEGPNSTLATLDSVSKALSLVPDSACHPKRFKLQRTFTVEADKLAAESRLLGASADILTVVGACSGGRGSSWMAPAVPHFSSWLDAPLFQAAIRSRLLLRMHGTGEYRVCTSCNSKVADVFGVHTLTCMHGGSRTHLHHGVCREWATILSEALMNPRREVALFGGADRLDVVAHDTTAGRKVAYDIAIVSPFAHAEVVQSKMSGGAAATAYEAKKRSRYAHIAASHDYKLVPMVFETSGGWGASASKEVRKVAQRWASHRGLPISLALAKISHRMTTAVIRGVATILLRTHGAHVEHVDAVAPRGSG
jgi:hypothetical protein